MAPFKRFFLSALGAAMVGSVLLLTGCAFTTGHVALEYQPQTSVTKVAQPHSPHLAVEVADDRLTRLVGYKTNGWGVKTAVIVSDTDVPGAVKTAFETELTNRGFTVGSGGDLVSVTLRNFQNHYSMEFWGARASADMGMDITVKRLDGTVAYRRYITGQHRDATIRGSSDTAYNVVGFSPRSPASRTGVVHAQNALNGALYDAISKVFGDTAFIEALNKP